MMVSTLFTSVDVVAMLEWSSAIVGVGVVIGLPIGLRRQGRRSHYDVERLDWRMPRLALLERPQASRARTLALDGHRDLSLASRDAAGRAYHATRDLVVSHDDIGPHARLRARAPRRRSALHRRHHGALRRPRLPRRPDHLHERTTRYRRPRTAGFGPAHDVEITRATRAGELQRAAVVAGFSRVVTLGYDDSGMKGWPQNDRPKAFMNADVGAVARTIAAILDEEYARVVVTYDENGFYGHPDHVMANVVTRAAIELAESRSASTTRSRRGRPRRSWSRGDGEGVSFPAWIVGRHPHRVRRHGGDDHGRADLRASQARGHRHPRFAGRQRRPRHDGRRTLYAALWY